MHEDQKQGFQLLRFQDVRSSHGHGIRLQVLHTWPLTNEMFNSTKNKLIRNSRTNFVSLRVVKLKELYLVLKQYNVMLFI